MEWRNNTQKFSYVLLVVQISLGFFSYNTNIFFIMQIYFLKEINHHSLQRYGEQCFTSPFK